MTCVDVCVTYSIEVPEIDEIYNKCGDPDLVDDKIDDVIEEIYHDPHSAFLLFLYYWNAPTSP